MLPYQCWALAWALPRYPAVALCYGDPAALSLQVKFLHMLQQIIAGLDERVSQDISLGLDLDSYRVGLPNMKWDISLMLTTSGLVHPHCTIRVDSPALTITGPALPPAPDIDGCRGSQLSAAHAAPRQMGNEDSSSMLIISGLAHPHLHCKLESVGLSW